MNTSFERSENTTDEWYTPIEIIQSFGEENARILKENKLEGVFLEIKR